MPSAARRGPAARTALALLVAAAAIACSRPIDPRLIEDAQLAARVKTAIVNDAEIGTRLIEVRVAGGVVRLSGTVASSAEADRAVTLARSVGGVVKVESEIQIRSRPPGGTSRGDESEITLPDRDLKRAPRIRSWLAVGLSASPRLPADGRLESSWTLSPLVRVGAGDGLGPAVGFSWFSAELEAGGAVGRVRVKPVMGGLSYTLRRHRSSASLSIVGGYAFNSFTLELVETGSAIPVSVGNSLVVRPGLSIWHDASDRIAFNLSAGHVITRPRLELLRDGRREKTSLRADTTIVGAGLAWKLF
jgi:hypothetical protein